MVVSTDVLIIGGGPSGIIAALTASKMGCKVILCDSKEKSMIGKKTCGDALELSKIKFVTDQLSQEIMPIDEEIDDEVIRMVFKTNKVTFPIERGKDEGFIVNRHKYGQRLLSLVEKEGITVLDQNKAIKVITIGNKVTGALIKNLKDNKTLEINSKITIDCSGRNYSLRKTLPQELFPNIETRIANKDIVISYREIIRLKDKIPDHDYHNSMYLFYDDDLASKGNIGYFWIFSKGKKRLNCGIGWYIEPKRNISLKDAYRKFMGSIYTSDQYTVEDAGGYSVPTRYPLTNAVADGFIVAGDAASHVNPLTAEGHGPAMKAGFLAGKIASEAIKSNNITEDGLWQYNQLIINNFGEEYSRVQIFIELLKSMKISTIESIVTKKVISVDDYINYLDGKKPGILNIIGRFFRLFPRYDLLWKFFFLWRKSIKITKVFAKYPEKPSDYPSWNKEFLAIMAKIKN